MFTALMVCLTLWGQNDVRAVHLPPRVRSLAQLAQELRAQGIAARCEAAIGNRLALVCVQDRSWDDLRPLLERGLELRFVRQPEGAWTLTADAGVAARETTLRNVFVKRYEKSVDDILTPALDGADALNRLDAPEKAAREKELRGIIGLPGVPGGSPIQREIADLTLNLAYYNGKRAALWPLRPLNLAPLLTSPVSHAQRVLDIAQDNSEAALRFRAGLQISRQNNKFADAAQLDWYSSLRFHPLTFSVTENIRGVFEPNGIVSGSAELVPGSIRHLYFGLRDVFTGAGQGDTLAADEQATDAWLTQISSGSNGDKPVSLEVGERSLSAMVQKWSAKNGREVIMEVSAHRDILPGYKTISSKLILNITRALQSGHLPEEGELDEGARVGELNCAALRYLNATPVVEKTPINVNMRVWTVSQAENVALIHNQLAFLDNIAPRNPAAMLLLTERRALHDDHLLTFDDLLDAARALPPRDNTLASGSSLYVGMGDFADAYPFLRLLDTYPQRDALQKELIQNGVAYLECRHCALSALNSLTDTLRSLALLAPNGVAEFGCFKPDFPQWLRQGVVEIKAEPSEFGKGAWLTFALYKSAERQPDQTYALPEALWTATVGPLNSPLPPASAKPSISP